MVSWLEFIFPGLSLGLETWWPSSRSHESRLSRPKKVLTTKPEIRVFICVIFELAVCFMRVKRWAASTATSRRFVRDVGGETKWSWWKRPVTAAWGSVGACRKARNSAVRRTFCRSSAESVPGRENARYAYRIPTWTLSNRAEKCGRIWKQATHVWKVRDVMW